MAVNYINMINRMAVVGKQKMWLVYVRFFEKKMHHKVDK